jgi:L-ascorbate metabolism protein UlaG (beta-lactamase superfamily)
MDGQGKKAEEKPHNTLYVFDYMGITVAHLGDMRSVPPQNEIESLGTVHIVLVPVGGGSGLNAAKAAEIVSLLEPNIVIPMHYSTPATKVPLDRLDKFLKEMGMHEAETVASLKVTKNSLPDETKLVVLDYQRE